MKGWCGGGHGAALSVAQGVQHADDAVPVAEIAATAKLVQHEDAAASGVALVQLVAVLGKALVGLGKGLGAGGLVW